MSRDDGMNGSPPGPAAGLPVEQGILLEKACDAFEAKWRGGGRPDVWAVVLELPESVRPAALRELLSRLAVWQLPEVHQPVLRLRVWARPPFVILWEDHYD